MTPTIAQWASAFAQQATSDLKTYQVLEASELPRCHSLHQLQMATEKIAKAYRLASEPGATPQSITQHRLGNFVEAFFRAPRSVERLGLGRYNVTYAKRKLAGLAHQVEQLAPTSDLSKRNAEYPWEVGETVCTPALEEYADFGARQPQMVEFLKFLTIAIQDFV